MNAGLILSILAGVIVVSLVLGLVVGAMAKISPSKSVLGSAFKGVLVSLVTVIVLAVSSIVIMNLWSDMSISEDEHKNAIS